MIAALLLVALEHLPAAAPLVGEVVLEQTSFVEVQRMFGAAPIQDNGKDGARFVKFVCHESADRHILLLWAGAISVNSLEVSGFALGQSDGALRKLKTRSKDDGSLRDIPWPLRCTSSAALTRGPAVGLGFSIGSTARSVRHALGRRAMRSRDYYDRTVVVKDGQGETVRGVEVSLKNGVVDALSAEQATTN
jgi:hypothetical protein